MRYRRLYALVVGGMVVSGSLYIMSAPVHAETVIGDQIDVSMYKGTFLVERKGGTDQYWYVDPSSGERYAVNTSNSFSRLLTNEGKGITKQTLQQLPSTDTKAHVVSYDMLQKFKGAIMLQVDANGKAWYLNPLDLKMYFLQNGNEGFTVAQGLALDISADRLDQIPETKKLGFTADQQDIVPNTIPDIDPSLYGDVFNIIEENHLYKDTFTGQDLYYGSLEGMAEATGDKYTQFFSPEKNKKFDEYFTGNTTLEGIGASIDTLDGTLFVDWLVKDAPAERAGLLPKDQILSINGESAKGISVESAVSRIKGPAGTIVKLQILRPSTGTSSEYSITREKITIPDVDGEALDNGSIAYFKFSVFTTSLIPQFQNLVDKLITPSTKGIIIDMRNNGGGVTDSAAQLADYWLTNGELIYSEHWPNQTTNYEASAGRDVPNIPTVILTNEGTASASEIFTSALMQHHDATVIGTKTYGKGTGQSIYNFADGSGMKMTTFEWFTAGGTSINSVGITPDIIVEAQPNGDPQLARAEQFIHYGY